MPSDLHEAANTTKEGGIAWFCPLKLYRHYSGCRIWSGLLYRNYIKLYVSFCAARPGFVAYLFVVQYTTAVLCRCFYIRFVLPLIIGTFLIISLVRILVSNHTVHPPKTIDRFCVVTVTPRILNDPATRFPAVFRPESYFLNLPRRRNTVPERLPLFECRKIP